MDSDYLKNEIEKAKNAVLGLPEPLKSKTYEKILERILDQAYGTKESSQPRKKSVKTRVKTKKVKNTTIDETIQKINNSLNRSEFADIHKLKKVLDKSLYILKIVNEELKIDGLNPSQIASALTEKFRIKTTKESVSMALMKTHYVDRIPTTINGSKSYIYKLMMAGEEYLKGVMDKIKNE